jgi:hypothetical protein
MGCFTGARARIVEKQQQGIVAKALMILLVRCGQQRLHFLFVQVVHGAGHMLFEMDLLNLATPFQMFWAVGAYTFH